MQGCSHHPGGEVFQQAVSPDKMSDTGDKDDFANKVRLITGSYGASAVVLILESWITKAKAGEKLDTDTPPSESYGQPQVLEPR
jgi:hypothetical protein